MSDTIVSTLSTLTTLTAADGENLAVQDWPLTEGTARGTVLLVHGLGEHAGRYDALARRLNAWGFAVRGYDQYGHGESGGPRGGLTSDMRLLNDLADMVDATRARMAPGQPLVLLGHSMGGLVAARFVALHLRPVDALVLSSPALDPGLNAVQKLLLATLPRILPNLRVGNGLDAQYLSHDQAVVAAYLADPLCHDRISGRLARFIADSGPATVARAAHWSVPTLLMWAGADKLVNPAGSRAFAAAAPRSMVQPQCFESLFHELFNESPDLAAPVFALLRQWLLQRCPAVG
ncbi:MAG: lysophospholipase [Gammaproteobacteria bacterium]|jgi:alpha-beta hydrolase superfamily lysophospholipase|nr:lysophospholipase [Gammaproteobacteria bacterium]